MSDEQAPNAPHLPSCGPGQDLDPRGPIRTYFVDDDFGKKAQDDIDEEPAHAERVVEGSALSDEPPESPQRYYEKLLAAWDNQRPKPTPADRQAQGNTGEVKGGAAVAAGLGALASGAGSALSGVGRRLTRAGQPPRSLLVAAHALASLDAQRSEMTALSRSLARNPTGPAAANQMTRLRMLGRSTDRLSQTLERKALASSLKPGALRLGPGVGAMILTETQKLNGQIQSVLNKEAAGLAKEAEARKLMERIARQVEAMIARLMKLLEPLVGKKGQAGAAAAPAP